MVRAEPDPRDDQDTDVDTGRRQHLVPWTKGDPRAVAAAKKGAATRRAQAAARRADRGDIAKRLRAMADTFERDDVGPMALATAVDVMGKVVRGEIKVRDPATLIRVLVDIARAEEGLPTGPTTIVAHVGTDAVARAMALRDEARAALARVVDVDSAQTGTDTDAL